MAGMLKVTDEMRARFRALYEAGARLLDVARELDISETRAKRLRAEMGLSGRKNRRDKDKPPRKWERAPFAVEVAIDYAAVDARWASQAQGARFEDVEDVRPFRVTRIGGAPKSYSITGNSGGMCAP